ncbi:hypothetical protein BMR02_04045 [Methylococcaceae bacterium HT1]|nr:hypothetical protein BMR02_04045 [Methylococcaceae bacterium HT1]TXL23177.1 hypothetical protein BMR03_04105 [Methylococcaceae bacterium HT2]
MSFKLKLVKLAIKWIPKKLIVWVSNIVLKDIAELTGFSFDLDTRKFYVQIQLVGESETIDVWVEDFAIITAGNSYKFIIREARSNRVWLGNILSRITGKEWEIPVIPPIEPHIEFIAELLKEENPKTVDQLN